MLADDQIAAELDAQLAVLRDTGLSVSHIDTHHHLHESEQIFRVMMAVAHRDGLALRCYGEDMYRILQAEGIHSPRFLVTEFYDDPAVSLETLQRIIAGLPDGVTELCCHLPWWTTTCAPSPATINRGNGNWNCSVRPSSKTC